MALAENARKSYFDRKTKERVFSVGDRVLVYFPKVPRGLNPKFYTKWRGSYEVVKKVGNLNLLVRASLHSKHFLVHVDRVRALSSTDKLVKLDGGRKAFPPLPVPNAFSGEKDECAEHNSPSDDFLAFIESTSESVVASRPPVQPAGWMTQAGAARAGISVPEISLPNRCWASSAYWRK